LEFGRELIKGNTHTIVLAVLNKGSQHGYGVAREIERLSGQTLLFKEGTLYPVLHALERDGMITGVWEVSDSGPPRKIYSITPGGIAELERRTRLWSDFSVMLNRVIKGDADAQPV
jgi:DNA-binding PadR family transcriptional regulator